MGRKSAESSVKAHLEAGVPASRLVLGIPFYGRGSAPYGALTYYRSITIPEGYSEQWDSEACAPYIADSDGKLVLGFENPRSIALKCDFIRQNGLLGAMYWDYAGDNASGDLRKAVAEGLMKR